MTSHRSDLLERVALALRGEFTGLSKDDSMAGAECVLVELAAEFGWQPIATAPTDGSDLDAYWPQYGSICPTRWDAERYQTTPRPHWTHRGDRIFGLCDIRKNQPTHWRPMPAPPTQDGE